ncbi:hypothetical protein [Ferrovibrio sp.]|uniref:hypothetical protein n=1 Tax=Ferrovibrio sp. TaxID=1917215 RepID=UPI00263524F4|nr:hypothetical protein [Ferrovibrio sp.]
MIEKDADDRRPAVQDIVHDIIKFNCHAAMVRKISCASLSQRKLAAWWNCGTGICGSTKKNLALRRI